MGELDSVLRKLDWMNAARIWPNGKRYLRTDAFGVILPVSLHRALGERQAVRRRRSPERLGSGGDAGRPADS